MASNPQPIVQPFGPRRVVKLMGDDEPAPRRSQAYREGEKPMPAAAPEPKEKPAKRKYTKRKDAPKNGSTARYATWDDGSVLIETESGKLTLTPDEAVRLQQFLAR